jgi:N-acetylglucosaminyl-diphospho-decaprenol L-rhamnosyltransferase
MVTSKPLLSIIILTWNTAEITEKCVSTIEKHLKNFSYQIIVADNDSSDNTAALITKHKNVKYFNTGGNLGFAKGNNAALPFVQADCLLFLNSDMELIDSSIEKMYRYLISHQNIGAIGPAFLNIDQSPQGSVFPPQTATNAFKEFFLGIPHSYLKYVPNTSVPSEVSSISGGAVMIKKDVFQKIGGWDESYFMYFEDLKLCQQVIKNNYQVYYFPDCQVVHHHGASGKNLASASNQWRRLIPSSKKYHGIFRHYLINFIIWSGQKWQKVFSKK